MTKTKSDHSKHHTEAGRRRTGQEHVAGLVLLGQSLKQTRRRVTERFGNMQGTRRRWQQRWLQPTYSYYYVYYYSKDPRSTPAFKEENLKQRERERESMNLFVHTWGRKYGVLLPISPKKKGKREIKAKGWKQNRQEINSGTWCHQPCVMCCSTSQDFLSFIFLKGKNGQHGCWRWVVYEPCIEFLYHGN